MEESEDEPIRCGGTYKTIRELEPNAKMPIEMSDAEKEPNMVEWFVKMVEERKTKHDSSKEEKNW